MPSLKLRIPSARPLPSSGSFFGPNKSRAIAATTSQCHGENSPITTSNGLYRQCQLIAYGRLKGKSNLGSFFALRSPFNQPFQSFTRAGAGPSVNPANGGP